MSSSLVLPIEAAALEAAEATVAAASAEAAAAAAVAAAAGGIRGCGLRAMVAVCNGFVELRATTLTFVLPVRVGLDTVAFEAVRAGLAAVEGLRGFGLVAGGDVVPAVVHMEGPVGVSVGGGGDDAGVVVVGGVVVGSGSEPKNTKKNSCQKMKKTIKGKHKNK